MSNVEIAPDEMACGEEAPQPAVVEVLAPREVPLGGPRAMSVRRTDPVADAPLSDQLTHGD